MVTQHKDSVTVELIPVDIQGKRMVRPVITREFLTGCTITEAGPLMPAEEADKYVAEQERLWLVGKSLTELFPTRPGS